MGQCFAIFSVRLLSPLCSAEQKGENSYGLLVHVFRKATLDQLFQVPL